MGGITVPSGYRGGMFFDFRIVDGQPGAAFQVKTKSGEATGQ